MVHWAWKLEPHAIFSSLEINIRRGLSTNRWWGIYID
jgi:hypothetical protein